MTNQEAIHLATRRIGYGSEDAFWSGFVADYWERRSVVLSGRDTLAFPTIAAEELFPAVVASADSFLAGEDQKIRLYIDGDQVDIFGGNHGDLLPKLTDRSFQGYDHRITHRSGFGDYALVVADCHQFSRPLWERVVQSVAALTQHVGISASRMDTQVFLGTYRKTPFGVHVDPTSSFNFPIIGKKRMRFWEASFVKDSPGLRHAHRYQPYLSESIVNEAVPGEIIYWPSSYWHIGESQGEFSVTWRFAYWFADGMRRRAMIAASNVFDTLRPTPLTSLPMTPTRSREIDGVEEVLREIEAASRSEELRAVVVANWLEHYSAFGFLRVPVPEQTIVQHGTLRLKPPFRLYASPVRGDRWCLAAAGVSRLSPGGTELAELVDALNAGEEVAMERIRSAGAEFLSLCFDSGAFDIVI